MKQYFYLDGDMKQHGPCSIDELRGTGITPATKVWSAGMPDWDDAGNVPELNALFRADVPPVAPPAGTGAGYSTPYPQQQQSAAPYMKPDSWLPWAIIATIVCCWPLPLGIPGIVYAAKVDGLWQAKQYDEAVRAAKTARTWTIIAIIFSAVCGLGYFLLVFFGVFMNIFAGL